MTGYLTSEDSLILESIVNEIKKAQKIALFTHEAADGDAIGSITGFLLFLKKLGKTVYAFIPGKIQENYLFLPGIKEINKITKEEAFEKSQKETDFIGISLDSADIERLGEYKELFSLFKKTIVIDHHYTNTRFGHINFVPFGKSSNSELLYIVLDKINRSLITHDIANALYLGIMTDTGSFHFSNATVDSFLISAELLKLGASPAYVSQNAYESKSFESLKLLGKALLNMQTLFDGIVVISVITKDMFNEVNATEELSEGIVDQLRKVKGSEIVVLIKEIEDELIRVSLRGKNNYSVKDIAVKFGGGGHSSAAGCTINTSLDVAKKMILQEIRNLILQRTVE